MKKQERRGISIVRVVILLPLMLVGLPVLYFLSAGPAVWLESRGLLPRSATTVVYDPLLGAAADVSPTAKRFIRWYVRLWD